MIFANVNLLNLYLVSICATSTVLIVSLLYFSLLAKLIGKYDNSKIKPSQIKRELGFLLFNSIVLNTNTIIWLYLSDKLIHPFNWQLNFWSIFATLIGLLISVEFFYYCCHRIYHWDIFMKHHIDHHKSITCQPITAQSFGIVETFTINLIAPFPFLFIMSCFVSLPFYAFLIWALTYYFLSLWLHSNIKFPPKVESILRKMLLLTPRMHSDHHQKFLGNYGLYTTIWDKLFKTEIKD
jgi:lathosterol oxidase